MVLRQRYYNLKYSGHEMYRQIIIQHFYVLATEWNNWFWEDLRSNIFYFPIQNYMSGLYDRDFTICSPLITVYTARLTFNFTTFCHRVNFCVLWGSVNKRRLFPYATLTDISIQQRFQHLKPTVHYMYRQIIIHLLYVLPTDFLYRFLGDLRTNFEYFLFKTKWMVFITEISPSNSQLSLYVPPDNHSTFLRSDNSVYLMVLCGSENQQRIFP